MIDCSSKDLNLSAVIYQSLTELSKKNPAAVRDHQDLLLQMCGERAELTPQTMQIISYLLTDDRVNGYLIYLHPLKVVARGIMFLVCQSVRPSICASL